MGWNLLELYYIIKKINQPLKITIEMFFIYVLKNCSIQGIYQGWQPTPLKYRFPV